MVILDKYNFLTWAGNRVRECPECGENMRTKDVNSSGTMVKLFCCSSCVYAENV